LLTTEPLLRAHLRRCCSAAEDCAQMSLSFEGQALDLMAISVGNPKLQQFGRHWALERSVALLTRVITRQLLAR